MRRVAAAMAAVSGAAAVVLALVAVATWPRPAPDIDPASTPTRAQPDLVPAITAGISAGRIETRSTDPADVAREASVSPTELRIDAIGLDMSVTPVGLTAAGDMVIPDHAPTAGWYKFSATPGERSGTALIAAHVADPFQGRGPFSRLIELKAGDVVTVTLSDGATKSFVVYKRHRTSKQVVDFDQVFADSTGMLVLVTCGGRWDSNTQHYEDNVIVWATPTEAS